MPINWNHSTTLKLTVELSLPAPKSKINAFVRHVGAIFELFQVNQRLRDVL
jgi:hypothetical protein